MARDIRDNVGFLQEAKAALAEMEAEIQRLFPAKGETI